MTLVSWTGSPKESTWLWVDQISSAHFTQKRESNLELLGSSNLGSGVERSSRNPTMWWAFLCCYLGTMVQSWARNLSTWVLYLKLSCIIEILSCVTSLLWSWSVCLALFRMEMIITGFGQVLQILESPWISRNHFPGLESPGILMQVLESPGNLNWATSFY